MRSVVITGAAAGIGAALAHRFARAGFQVALIDLDAAAVTAREAELVSGGAVALALPCDVTSPADCTAALEQVVTTWGGIDVLINNAGITHVGLVRDTDTEVIKRVLEVNFLGAVHCTHAALPSLLARRGQVAALSSVAGFAPLATRAGYAASKHALHGFFGSLRVEHARDGLGVTLVCPSFVRTGIGERALGEHGQLAGAGARSGVRREIEPNHAAETIFRGVQKRRPLVLVGAEAHLAWWVTRLWPAAYERAMARRTLSSQPR
ncbi:MAG: SDR family oxidoreductase [Deltaproteobacteria bacterium]|nr:SDR family oxidoreductase [Deltaproteobacteria bacterium]